MLRLVRKERSVCDIIPRVVCNVLSMNGSTFELNRSRSIRFALMLEGMTVIALIGRVEKWYD